MRIFSAIVRLYHGFAKVYSFHSLQGFLTGSNVLNFLELIYSETVSIFSNPFKLFAPMAVEGLHLTYLCYLFACSSHDIKLCRSSWGNNKAGMMKKIISFFNQTMKQIKYFVSEVDTTSHIFQNPRKAFVMNNTTLK